MKSKSEGLLSALKAERSNRQLLEEKVNFLTEKVMTIAQLKEAITPETPRDLETLQALCLKAFPLIKNSVKSELQKSIIIDTVIWFLGDHGWYGKLPFTYGEAYLKLGVSKDFLK